MYFELAIGLSALAWGLFLSFHPLCKTARYRLARHSPLRCKLFITLCALVNVVAVVHLRHVATHFMKRIALRL